VVKQVWRFSSIEQIEKHNIKVRMKMAELKTTQDKNEQVMTKFKRKRR